MGKLQIKWNIFFLFLASTYCLSLSYHMKGSPGSLSIAAGESEQSSTVVWQKSGHQGDGWLTVSVDIRHDRMVVAFTTTRTISAYCH
jgi:hypothetical protein